MPIRYGKAFLAPWNLQHPWEHGNDVVLICVSLGEESKHFTMHRDLLSRSSPYLQELLCSETAFKYGLMTLDGLCPTAFEVIYQWLYTGRVFNEPFYMEAEQMKSEVYWLRAYKIARVLKLRELPEMIQDHIEKVVHDRMHSLKPSNQFIHELHEAGPTDVFEGIRSQVVERTAYTMKDQSRDRTISAEWKLMFKDIPEFGTAVLDKICDLPLARAPARDRAPCDRLERHEVLRDHLGKVNEYLLDVQDQMQQLEESLTTHIDSESITSGGHP